MKRLKELREWRNLKQGELAKDLNVSQSTIAMWESGKRDPDTETTKVVANFFGVSVDYLIGNSDYPHPGEIAAAHIDGDKSYDDITDKDRQMLDEIKQVFLKYNKKEPDKSP